ncbi:LrgB family protein [Lampropedia puyangensis]|uniref:LrgB family protein n=2 Tax=Lampropedia puyangensis TaxID=1330072 RepID=A0A4S8F653_9BURK|nr:LrgB family protein [Lampropedia puyangensis]
MLSWGQTWLAGLTWQAVASTWFWSGLTIMVYLLAVAVYRRSGGHALAIPVLTGGAVMVAVLVLSGTAYQDYAQSVALLKWMLVPALLLLAVPMRQQLQRLRAVWLPLTVAVLAGSATAIASTMGIALLLGVDETTLISMLPKSATMPIAIQGAQALGGAGGIVALNVVATGVLGAMMVPLLLRMLRVEDEVVRAATSGLVAHAIGTAREMQDGPTAGAFAALAMSMTGLCTAIMLPIAVWLMRCFMAG